MPTLPDAALSYSTISSSNTWATTLAAPPAPLSKKKIKIKPKNKNKLYNIPLTEAFINLQQIKTSGEIGLEIECEGMNLFDSPISYWKTETDGSLRPHGEHPPIEYVLRKPLSRTDITKALRYLTKKLREAGSKIDDSYRTSVHVHVNCQDLTMKQVTQFWCLYVVFEEMLVRFSGPDREGNLFCLRAKDAEHSVHMMEQGLKSDNYQEIFSEHLRYTSCNTASLGKFGSLEFRSMRGTVDEELIQVWIDILCLLKDKALEYDSPKEICIDFEAKGPQKFFDKILGHDQRIKEIFNSYTYKDKMMWDGMRLMRDVAYAVKWEKLDPKLIEKKDLEEKDYEIEYLDKERCYLQYSHYLGSWWVCNWNNDSKNLLFRGQPYGLSSKRAYKADPMTGKYLEDHVTLPFQDLQEPQPEDHPVEIVPEPDPDFEPDYYDEPIGEPEYEPEP